MTGYLLAKTVSDETSLLPVLAVCLLVTLLCGWLHFEALQLMVRYVKDSRISARRGILMTMVGLVTVHLLEIAIFALGYLGLFAVFGSRVGVLQGNVEATFSDLMYFSFVVFTTVGFGDIVPDGPLRILAGVEALVGLMLITWSASFTFLIMQAKWKQEYGS